MGDVTEDIDQNVLEMLIDLRLGMRASGKSEGAIELTWHESGKIARRLGPDRVSPLYSSPQPPDDYHHRLRQNHLRSPEVEEG